MYLFAGGDVVFQYSFSSSVWSQVVHINLTVFAVLKCFLLVKKQ